MNVYLKEARMVRIFLRCKPSARAVASFKGDGGESGLAEECLENQTIVAGSQYNAVVTFHDCN